ncbi:MAG: type IV pilus assembly protein PilM [Candidatus Omnitrophica bacterium]|nr:type IV pilus assembly protein PilM [Candidatus Omnitrophota bacterium]
MARPLLEQLERLRTRWPKVAAMVRPTPTCLGLDLGSQPAAGVVLQKTGDTVTLVRTASLPIPPGADTAARVQQIRQLLNMLEGTTKPPVVAAVGGPGTVLRHVLLPKMTAQELTTALAFEAEKHIPFKLDEAVMDSVILGDRSDGRMEILLAAARKELVETTLALLTAAGVAPKALDLDTVALANAWELSPQGPATDTVGVLHIGARGTIVMVFTGTQLQFTREIPLAGDTFTQAVATALSVEAAGAEALIAQPGERGAEVQAALQPSWDDWLGQCRGSFDFYENQVGRGVGRVVLSGASARMAGLAARVRETGGWPTDVWNPLAGVQTATPIAEGDAVTLGIAIGLARRGLS